MTQVELQAPNFNGYIATITLTPDTGGTVSLGSYLMSPAVISIEYPYGQYELYFSAFSNSCYLTISSPSTTPTQTPSSTIGTTPPATPTPTQTPTNTSTPTSTIGTTPPTTPTQTQTPSQTASNTPTPSITPSAVVCNCYWLLNETGGVLNYSYTQCGGIFISDTLAGGAQIRICSEDLPAVDAGITSTPCGITCTVDADCTGCT